MSVLNFGSLNIDHVYSVEHICRPGETIASRSYALFAGGKGANQTAALALAGAQVAHGGMVGPDGSWLVEKLDALGADVQHIATSDRPTGQAIIQVEPHGQNSIVLHAGANKEIPRTHIRATLSCFGNGDILLLQNEINDISYLINEASLRNLCIYFNPAPFGPEVLEYPLQKIRGLILNETEAAGMASGAAAQQLSLHLAEKLTAAEILITRGAGGSEYRCGEMSFGVPAEEVEAVDTTAAGDTFIGYYLATRSLGADPQSAVKRATAAAAICVSRPGAMDSIPSAAEVDAATA